MAGIAENRRFDLRKPLIASAVALLVALLITIYGTDIAWFLYSVAVAVFGSFVLLGWIALRAVFRKRQHALTALAIFGAYVAVTAVFFIGNGQFRPMLRWTLRSHRYKSEVLATAVGEGEFKHVEWDGDGWGSGPTGDWMSYSCMTRPTPFQERPKTMCPQSTGVFRARLYWSGAWRNSGTP